MLHIPERGPYKNNGNYIIALMTLLKRIVHCDYSFIRPPPSSSASPSTSSTAQTITSTSLPSSHPSRPSSSDGLASSTKIGVGLGVSFGVTIFADVAFLYMRHIRQKGLPRHSHSGNIAAAGLYPAGDQDMKVVAVQTERKTNGAASLEQTCPLLVFPLERTAPLLPLGHEEGVSPLANIRVLHGWDVPPYSRYSYSSAVTQERFGECHDLMPV